MDQIKLKQSPLLRSIHAEAAIGEHFQNIDNEKLPFMFTIKRAYENGQLTLHEARDRLKQKVSSLQAYEVAIIEQELKKFEQGECRKEDMQSYWSYLKGFWQQQRHNSERSSY